MKTYMDRKLHNRCIALLLILFLLACPMTSLAQSAPTKSKPAFAPDKMDTVLYGVAYYPEYMPHDRLDKDIEMMQNAGITVVRGVAAAWRRCDQRNGDV